MHDSEQISQIKKWLGSGSINLFGRPFAGKDVQGVRLSQMLDCRMIGGGEILRSQPMPDHIKHHMKTGQLIPTDDYIDIVLPYLNKGHVAHEPLVLNSIGRWHGEEVKVMDAIKESGHELKAVIYLNIPEHEAHKRWLKRDTNKDRLNRYDDKEDVLKVRFKEFKEKTLPVINYYSDAGCLIRINGETTRDEVTQNILDALTEIAKK